MVNQCAVRLCPGNYRNGQNVHKFSFPKDEELRKKWIAAINRADFEPSIHAKVCGLHFHPDDIERRTKHVVPETGEEISAPLKFPRLVPNAVPTRFLDAAIDPSMEMGDPESLSPNTSTTNSVNNSPRPYTDAVNCKKVATHVKRPMNPFMVWSQIERRKIVSEHPDMHNAEISKQLGIRWKELQPDQRKPFIDESNRLRQLHELEFPGYKFKPKKKARKSLLDPKDASTSRKKPGPKSKGCGPNNYKYHPPSFVPDRLHTQRTLLPKILPSHSKPSNINLPFMLAGKMDKFRTNAFQPKDQTLSPHENLKETLGGLAAMAKQIQSNDSNPGDQSNDLKTDATNSDSQPLNSISFSVLEEKVAVKNDQPIDFSDKPMKDELTEQKETTHIDEKCQEIVKETKITQPEEEKKNSNSSPKIKNSKNSASSFHKHIERSLISGSIETKKSQLGIEKINSNLSPKIKSTKPSASSFRKHIDGSLTSGSICAIADSSTDDNCLETFDKLSDIVIKSSKVSIKSICRRFETLRQANNSSSGNEFDFPEGDIPTLSELLGENWIQSKLEFEMP